MSLRYLPSLAAVAAVAAIASGAQARELRVCLDPNNLPYSHEDGSGFENKLVEIVAREMNADVKYVWHHQWRGFVRKTLRANLCDIIPGIAKDSERVRTTRPYYRSTYVFVTRADALPVRSFTELLLSDGKIGVQLIGDDGINTPPVEELAARGLKRQMKGYMVWGRKPNAGAPLEEIMRGVADGEVDVAIVWGPAAGYFATREKAPLTLTAAPADEETVTPMAFSIAMGVRKEDEALAEELDAVLTRAEPEINALLDEYGVPRVPEPTVASGGRG